MNKQPIPPKGSAELYQKAVEVHKLAYAHKTKTKERYKIRLGHMLQHLFGKKVWTLKDLTDPELGVVINLAQRHMEKHGIHSSPVEEKA